MTERDSGRTHGKTPEGHLPFSQLAAYGAGGIIPIALFNIAGILVGLMGNISLGLSAFWLGAIMIVPRFWDALSDPIIGHLSDNTRTRWGRRRPYLLIGAILVAVFFVVMWWIPKGDMVRAWFPTESGFRSFQLCFILLALLLFFTAVNLFEIPHGALGMEMTTDYHERTRLFSAKSFVGNLFAMSTPWLFALANMEVFKGPGGNEADGMRYVSLLVAAIIVPLSFWWFATLREPGFAKAAQHEKTPFWKDMKQTASNRNFIMLTLAVFTLAMGFNFVQLLGSYIPIFYVYAGDKVAGATLLGINGTVWAVTGLLAVFPLNWISPRLGKRNTLVVAMLLMCVAQLSKIVCYDPQHPYLIVIPTVLLSTGMLFFFTLGSSMVGDICDESDLNSGHRSEGSYYAVFWWFIKLGTALASFVAGLLIVFTLFDEAQVTKVDGLQGSVRELRSDVQSWQAATTATSVEAAKTRLARSLEESKEYARYLEKESLKDRSRTEHRQRRSVLAHALSAIKTAVTELEQLQRRLATVASGTDSSETRSVIQEAVSLTLRTKVEKARVKSFELLSHLEAKSLERQNSKEHYSQLIAHITRIDRRLEGMQGRLSLHAFDGELAAIEAAIVPVRRQTPYTLLMMRVIEIGLPVLLALLSIFFVLRYSLTETRCLEIKQLLARRDAERAIAAAASPANPTA